MYTGDLQGQNAACDVCSGCRCIAGTTRGADGTCDPVSKPVVTHYHAAVHTLYVKCHFLFLIYS